MKHWTNKFLAAGLAMSLLAGQAAVASDALGHDLHTGTAELSQGVTLTRSHFWSDTYRDLRTEHYLTYTPGAHVQPAMAYGETVIGKASLTEMARTLEDQGKRVLGGTNGDFYVVSTGQPLGLVVTDGILRSSSSYLNALGFRADGTAFIGRPELRLEAALPAGRFQITGGLNKIREVNNGERGGLTLLNRDFAESTENTSAGVDVILRPAAVDVGEPVPGSGKAGEAQVPLVYSDVPRIGSRMACQVERVLETRDGDPATPIQPGTLILTMNAEDNPYILDQLRALTPGTRIEIDIYSEDRRWNEAVEATGALRHLLDKGAVVPGLDVKQAPRTAAGIRPDGSVIFYTIDGRIPGYSVGASDSQVALRLLELGCVDAVGLDGGGSTTLGATYPDGNSLEIVNRPSGGKERSNATALFLTTDLEPTGDPASLMLTPGDAVLLSGSTLALRATAVDSSWYAMDQAEHVRFSVSGPGEVDAAGVLTAGVQAGTATVTASAPGGIRGQATITVVDTPDLVTVANQDNGAPVSVLALEPGQKIDLTAAAQWRKLSLVSQDTSYIWRCDPAVGRVNDQGVLTAGAQAGKGELTVTAGGYTVTIPVSVAGHVLPLADMEGELSAFQTTDTVQIQPETRLTHVRTGRRSLRVDYSTRNADPARLDTSLSIPAGERFLGLWLRGDGSDNRLSAVFADAAGRELSAPVDKLGADQWQHFQMPIPEGAVRLAGLQVDPGSGDSITGSLWLDQLTTSTEAEADTAAPGISLIQRGGRITAAVSDNMDRSFPAGAVTMTVDGMPVSAEWNASGSLLIYTLPPAAENSGFRRVTVTAVDVSGNLSRASLDIGTPDETAFADLESHWARPYADYLYRQKVTNGVTEGDRQYFLPDNNITRAEFFTMTARWLGLDLDVYGETVLPFSDEDLIPAWALPAIRAMYALGYVGGSQGPDGLAVHPHQPISRAEAMTILGRIQRRGWAESDLDLFTDGGQVPDWAADYVRSLVGQAIVGGYEDGTLRPGATMTRGQAAKILTVLR